MKYHILDKDLYADHSFRPAHDGDAGIDLRSTIDATVHAGETVRIPLGISVILSSFQVGWVTGRSSTALKFGLLSHDGKIDSGYRGEINHLVTALGSPVNISRGERVCQLVIVNIADPMAWREATDWEVNLLTERGTAGLGSTGRT